MSARTWTRLAHARRDAEGRRAAPRYAPRRAWLRCLPELERRAAQAGQSRRRPVDVQPGRRACLRALAAGEYRPGRGPREYGEAVLRGLRLERRGDTLLAIASATQPCGAYHWWADGDYAGSSRGPRRSFSAPGGLTLVLDCRPTRSPHVDGRARGRPQPHGRLELEWLRTDAAELHEYLVQVRVSGGGAWSTVQRVRHVPGRWDYRVRTPQLADDTLYEFQVVPVDAHGNSGTALSLGAQRVVRLPDSVPAAVTYDGGTGRFTVDAL